MSVWIDLPIAETARRYEAGESSTQLGHVYGVSSPTILSHLRRAGVEIRAPGAQLGSKRVPGWHRRGGPLYTSQGYLRTADREGRGQLVHRGCWEAYYGAIPEGYVVHHCDGDILNNEIENLMRMTHGEHSRLHRLQAEEKGGTR